MSMRKWCVAAFAAAFVVVGLAGCSVFSADGEDPGDDAQASGGTARTASSASASSSPSAPGDGDAAPAVTATPVSAGELTPLIAGRTVKDHQGNPLTIMPVTLRRQGTLVILEVAARHEGREDSATAAVNFQHIANVADVIRSSSAWFDEVTLVDPVNAKRYIVARDSEGKCLCTSLVGGLSVRPGNTAIVTAYFAAPPPSVRVLNVEMPGVGSFPDVPVSG